MSQQFWLFQVQNEAATDWLDGHIAMGCPHNRPNITCFKMHKISTPKRFIS